MRPKIFLADEHDIDFSQLDPDALFVIQRLQEAGFVAYLVGGGVRDLLVKKKPKDFDVSTSARPEEIKHLFRKHCLLIGRRFRLAHIRFGKKIIEVSTFRSGESAEDLIVRDNQWGTPEEDAVRRDFTINGLFYDPTEHHVIDYVGGWDDIHQSTLRTIGDAVVRFRQDPVRMIRLLKFQARFDFKVAPDADKALKQCLDEISKSSPARVLEEIFRMLESGSSEPFFRLLQQQGFLELLFPWLSHFLEGPHADTVYSLLAGSDRYHKDPVQQETLDRSILSTCLQYPILHEEIRTQYLDRDYIPHVGEISNLAASIGKAVSSSSFSHFPRRLRILAHYIMTMQYRMTPLNQKIHYRSKIVRHPDFSLALDFLRIRALADPSLRPIYDGWRAAADEPISDQDAGNGGDGEGAVPPRPRRRRRPSGRGRRPHASQS
ncbi:MAG: polynucleotide adenylyltransferase PcnB [Chlamydiales bacterium]|nr:polynucleotide adenylyltransferase PcnB [Chlamydiales bacterium]